MTDKGYDHKGSVAKQKSGCAPQLHVHVLYYWRMYINDCENEYTAKFILYN
jgi:hypothetical protein